MTHRTASMTLDFPQPLGPTIAVIFVGKGTTVESTKDLKPTNLMDFKRIKKRLPEGFCYYKLLAMLRKTTLACKQNKLPLAPAATPSFF
jgi:hypothetical protein